MKITEISIKLEPNEFELSEGRAAVELHRGSDKIWKVRFIEIIRVPGTYDEKLASLDELVDVTLQRERGLFPYEIRLANDIQEKIIQFFNSNEKSS